MSFVVYQPCPALQPYIRLLAVQEADSMGMYRVLPGTGLVMGFQYRGGLSYHAGQGRVPLAAAGITGICETYRVFENTAHTGTVLVVFHEGQAAPFFRLPLHELAQQSVALADLVPATSLVALQQALAEATTAAERVRQVEAFLLAQLRPAAPDRLVQAALAMLHATHGTVRIQDLTRQIGTSASPLEKRFRQLVGTTPKKLATLLRLQTALARYRPDQSLTALSYAAGFYDQAHFIHAFQAFTGQPPALYFRDVRSRDE